MRDRGLHFSNKFRLQIHVFRLYNISLISTAYVKKLNTEITLFCIFRLRWRKI